MKLKIKNMSIRSLMHGYLNILNPFRRGFSIYRTGEFSYTPERHGWDFRMPFVFKVYSFHRKGKSYMFLSECQGMFIVDQFLDLDEIGRLFIWDGELSIEQMTKSKAVKEYAAERYEVKRTAYETSIAEKKAKSA